MRTRWNKTWLVHWAVNSGYVWIGGNKVVAHEVVKSFKDQEAAMKYAKRLAQDSLRSSVVVEQQVIAKFDAEVRTQRYDLK